MEFGLIKKYKTEKKEREMEEELPELLYHASNMIAYASPEEVLKWLSSQNTVISKEFKRVYIEILKGEAFDRALNNMNKRINSPLISRAIKIFALEYRTGTNNSLTMKEIADDTQELLQAQREKNAAQTIEKYTLLIAGAFIVPLMLGAMVSISNGMGQTNMGFYDFDDDHNELILSNSILGAQIYTIIYAVMASFFIAFQENKKHKMLGYVLFLLPTSLIVFNLTQNMSFFNVIG